MLPSLILAAGLLASHEVVASTTTHPSALLEREVVTVAFGDAAFERFDVTHVSAPWSRLPMVLVTPLGFGASWYETSEQYRHTLAGRLALLGVDLYIVEQRRGHSGTLPVGSCAGDPAAPVPPPVDCSPLGAWDFDDQIEDILFVRDELVDSRRVPTLGGQWTGGVAALGVVDADPEAFSGLLLWEGTIYTQEPFTLAKNASVCSVLESIPDAFGADSSPAVEQLATQLAEADPNGLSPFPAEALAPFGLVAGEATNLDVLHAIFIADSPALLDRVAEGLVFMAGTIEDGPSISDIDHIFALSHAEPAPTYGSVGILTDYICGLGGDPTHVSNLAAFDGDVLVIGSDRGLVDELQDTLDAFTSARHTFADFRTGLGVHDLLFSDLRPQVDLEIVVFNAIAQH